MTCCNSNLCQLKCVWCLRLGRCKGLARVPIDFHLSKRHLCSACYNVQPLTQFRHCWANCATGVCMEMSWWYNPQQYQHTSCTQTSPSLSLSKEVDNMLPATLTQYAPFRTLQKESGMNDLSSNFLSK